jgi:hypothetical protein
LASQEMRKHDYFVVVLSLTVLLGDGGPERGPKPRAVREVIAGGAIPPLLHIMATYHSLIKEREAETNAEEDEDKEEEDVRSKEGSGIFAAFEPLRIIAHDPRGEAAIAAADPAGPLIAALVAAFKLPLIEAGATGDESRTERRARAEGHVSKSVTRDVSVLDVREDTVGLIGKLLHGRARLGDAFLSAGLAGELARLLALTRAQVERKLAMQLTEQLVRHVPGACGVLRADGVFAQIHCLTLPAAPVSRDRSPLRDVGKGEGKLSQLRARGSLRDKGDPEGTLPESSPGSLRDEGVGEGTLPESSQGSLRDKGVGEGTLPLRSHGSLRAEGAGKGTLSPRSCGSLNDEGAGKGTLPPGSHGFPNDEGAAEGTLSPRSHGSPRHDGLAEGTVPLRARGSLGDEGAGETMLPLEFTTGTSEAEAAQATALLCLVAGHCGGVLELGENTDGVPIRYTAGSVTDSNPGPRGPREDAPPTGALPDASVPRSSKKVCSMCGAASHKHLQVCSRCRGPRYCGRTCQAAHWPVHKRECRG